MKRIGVLLQLAAVLVLCIGTTGATCDPAYVFQSGNVISVLPTGSDDTSNLQCAFTLASTIPGVILQLGKGTYVTGRIVVNGFSGTIRGMGIDATVIQNPNYPIYVTPNDFYLIPPESNSYAPPYLIAFLGGDYKVMDLTFSIIGDEPATGWSIFGIPYIKSLAGPLVILGSATGGSYREANASFQRVKIKGAPSNDPLFGYNTYNGIFPEGFASPDLLPLKGTFTVSDSVFDSVASATPVVNLVDSRVSLSGNTTINVLIGGEVSDLKNTVYDFEHNQISGYSGMQIYDTCLGPQSSCGTGASNFIVKNNSFRTTEGLLITPTFLDGTTALMLGNNFAHVTDVAVLLGAGTSNCTVVGVGNGTVVDLGTNNSVTGMKKTAAAQGQQIKTLLEIAKGH